MNSPGLQPTSTHNLPSTASGMTLCIVHDLLGKRSAEHQKRDLGLGMEELQGPRYEEGSG